MVLGFAALVALVGDAVDVVAAGDDALVKKPEDVVVILVDLAPDVCIGKLMHWSENSTNKSCKKGGGEVKR